MESSTQVFFEDEDIVTIPLFEVEDTQVSYRPPTMDEETFEEIANAETAIHSLEEKKFSQAREICKLYDDLRTARELISSIDYLVDRKEYQLVKAEIVHYFSRLIGE